MSEARIERRRRVVVARWLARLLAFALALCVASSLVVVIALPRAMNGAALTVLTGSMSPGIPAGSIVLVRPVDPRTLRVGDIATYQVAENEKSFITHRIVNVHNGSKGLRFTFKGDANPGPDLRKVPAGAVRGEVWFHVPYLGAIRDGLHGKGGISLLAMLLLAGYALLQVVGGLRGRTDAPRGRHGGSVTAGLTIGKTLILAEFPTPSDGESPSDLAHRWAGLLIDSNETTYSLLIAPPPDGLVAALELLESQSPVRLQVWEAPNVLLGSPHGDQEGVLDVTTSTSGGRHVAR